MNCACSLEVCVYFLFNLFIYQRCFSLRTLSCFSVAYMVAYVTAAHTYVTKMTLEPGACTRGSCTQKRNIPKAFHSLFYN